MAESTAAILWEKHPLTQALAREMRACTRARRPQIDGHGFRYADLKELWCSQDGKHAVLIHDGERVWQYWHKGTEDSWAPLRLCAGRDAAQDSASEHLEAPVLATGLYVLAWMTGGRTIRVRCTSQDGPPALTSIFARLGYITHIEEVP